MAALFAHETEFFIKETRNWWLDEGFTNPLSAPEAQIIAYVDYSSPCESRHILTLREILQRRLIRKIETIKLKANDR